MEAIHFNVPKELAPFINCIMIKESLDPKGHMNMPFYADGYPGIMFQQAENGFFLLPRNKKLSELFLYGQTIEPISLDVHGPYRFVVFQLYPFASKYLLGVDPKILNDDCFDLLQVRHIEFESYRQQLIQATEFEEQIQVIARLMLALIQSYQIAPDDRIQQAIELIIQHKGQIMIRTLYERLHLTERTFERKFLAETGLTPKQFARIIQFQSSLHQLTQAKYQKLVEIGLDSGFADQPHFIRTFKKYTGQTPSYYLKHYQV